MIASVEGVVAEKNLNDAVVDVNGVGYRVFFSLLSMAKLEVGQRLRVRTRTIVAEDKLDLYGFLSRAEEDLFLLLTSVSQVGPKLALNVLSGLEVDELTFAIGRGEVARLTKIHGVGKKTAERLVLELKDKVKAVDLGKRADGSAAPASKPPVLSDVVSALINLGYKQAQAEKAAEGAASRVGEGAEFEAYFRDALKGLRSGT